MLERDTRANWIYECVACVGSYCRPMGFWRKGKYFYMKVFKGKFYEKLLSARAVELRFTRNPELLARALIDELKGARFAGSCELELVAHEDRGSYAVMKLRKLSERGRIELINRAPSLLLEMLVALTKGKGVKRYVEKIAKVARNSSYERIARKVIARWRHAKKRVS